MNNYSRVKSLLYTSTLFFSLCGYSVASVDVTPFSGLIYKNEGGEFTEINKDLATHLQNVYNSHIKTDEKVDWTNEKRKKSLQAVAVICDAVISGKSDELTYSLEELGLNEDGTIVGESGILTAEQLSAIMGNLLKNILVSFAGSGTAKFAGEVEDYIPRLINSTYNGTLLLKEAEESDKDIIAIFKYLESLSKNKNKEYLKIVNSVAYYIGLLELNKFKPFINGKEIGEIDKESKTKEHENHREKPNINLEKSVNSQFEIKGEKKINGKLKNDEPKGVPVVGSIGATDLNLKNIGDISKELKERNIGLHDLINDTFTRLDLPLSISRDADGKSWKITALNPGVPVPPPTPPAPGAPIVLFTPSADELKHIDEEIIKASNGRNNLSTVVSLGLKNVGTTLSRNGDDLQFLTFNSKFATATAVKTEPKTKPLNAVYCLSSKKTNQITWKKEYENDPLLGGIVYKYDIKSVKPYSSETKSLDPTPDARNKQAARQEIYDSLVQMSGKPAVEDALKNILTSHVKTFEVDIDKKQKDFNEELRVFTVNGEKGQGAERAYKTIIDMNNVIKGVENEVSPLLISLAKAGNKSYKDLQFSINEKKYKCCELEKWISEIVNSMKTQLKTALLSNDIFNKLFVVDKNNVKNYISIVTNKLFKEYNELVKTPWKKDNNKESDETNEKLYNRIKNILNRNELQVLSKLCRIYSDKTIWETSLAGIDKNSGELVILQLKTQLDTIAKYADLLKQKEARPELKYKKAEKKPEKKETGNPFVDALKNKLLKK